MSKSFKAQIEDFAGLTEKQMIAVVVDSVQDVLEAAQTSQPSVKVTGGSFEIGKIPVDTRSLIQSLEVGYNGSYSPTQGATTLSVGGFQLGYTINARWTAACAMRIENGFSGTDELGRTYNQAGRHFLGTNAARWPEIVKANAAKYRVK
jgi:hypothetical protein